MTDAQTILKMIEEVDPADTAKLDEIDTKVAFFIENKPYKEWKGVSAVFDLEMRVIPSYTRSRDALKAIRPDGWAITINSCAEFSRCHIQREDMPFVQECNYMWEPAPTEELAELHAIIQALEYERKP